MYRHKIAWSLAATALLITTIVVGHDHGTGHRRFAQARETVSVDAPEKAYAVWQRTGVKGRTLVLFDRYPHMHGRFNYQGEPQLEHSNLIEYSIFQNVIRKLYFIVPDENWVEFLQQPTTKVIKPIAGLERGVSLYDLNGLPMIGTTPSSLPHLSEPVLVYINGDVFDARQAQDLLTRKGISSDITVIYQGNRK
ncbi:hypothetical protein [Geomonas anaerohicana]|uniref:Rhodanese-like domain-containing protein n=1 Tax=Geomonas anaerohicana TaxID=2798583 RepID=A0ABS0YJ03_9BACT|nr:hypothetical protein [Geomonas anaerohicana]MBJ6752227.1 hypothetical protein [Geomonas anaerohicana]